MEELIGLLVAAAILVFKYIGKRLEQSGNPGKARMIRELAEALDGEDSPMQDWEYSEEALPAEEDKKEPVKPLPEPSPKPLKTKKQIASEEAPQKQGERIDSRKLVIYSEIMKPKFKE